MGEMLRAELARAVHPLSAVPVPTHNHVTPLHFPLDAHVHPPLPLRPMPMHDPVPRAVPARLMPKYWAVRGDSDGSRYGSNDGSPGGWRHVSHDGFQGSHGSHDETATDLFTSPVPTTGPRVTTTRRELWSWYVYYVGNSGLGPFNFATTAWQNLLHRASVDPATGSSADCKHAYASPCVLHAFGGVRKTHVVVLITNAIMFGLQAAVFLVLGSVADYGAWRGHIVSIATVAGWAVSLGWLGVMAPPRWRAGTVLYVGGMLTYRVALTFWMAAFPALARDLPEMRMCERGLGDGRISKSEFVRRDMLARNNLAHVSFFLCSVGELVVLAVLCGIIMAIAQGDDESNTRALSIVCAYSAGVWMFCALPWMFNEQHRPGHPLPPGTTYLTAGARQLYRVLTHLPRLKQTTRFLVAYFFMADCLTTLMILIKAMEDEIVHFDALTLNYLLMDGIAAQALGVGLFWIVQKHWGLATRTMLLIVCAPMAELMQNGAFILFVAAWGCVGITQNIGFHHVWEFWVYQGFYGIFVSPFHAISQAMISEVVPRTKEFLFFSLFAVVSQTSVVGLVASSAIAQRAGSLHAPFMFLLGLGAVAMGILATVDVEKSRHECRAYLEDEAVRVYGVNLNVERMRRVDTITGASVVEEPEVQREALREERGTTVDELADALGYRRAGLERVERPMGQ